jgi:uncharacterized protein with HEPN domain
MPPTAEDRMRDIVEAIAEIDEMLAGMTLDEFSTDKTRRRASERYLEVVCEAARRLPDEVKQDAPNIDWRKMTDFANLLRHAYQATKIDIVWDIIQNHLPPLRSFVERRVRASGT